MAALQGLIPASFRGVPFLCPDGTKDSGRHAVKHEYPDSSQRFVEDNGFCVPNFKINCVVHGADALSRLRRLEAAINTPGPGTLVHPIHGRQFVQAGKYHLKHDDKDVGVYTIDCEFFVTGPASFPGMITGIAASITGLSASAIGSLFSAFQAGIAVYSVASLAANTIQTLAGSVTAVARTMTAEFGDVASLHTAANGIFNRPEALVGDAAGLTSTLTTVCRSPFNDAAVTQDRLWDGFLALSEASAGIVAGAAAIHPTTLDLATRQDVLTLTGTTLQAVAFASLCEAAAAKSVIASGKPYSYTTAEQIAGDVAALTVARETLADGVLSTDDQNRLNRLFTETVAVLQKQQVALPEVRSMKVDLTPASVLCYNLYESDASLDVMLHLNAGQNPTLYDGSVNILRNA